MQTLKIRSIRLDTAPTEVQMKLAIAQILSLPFAYGSPVIVLEFDVNNSKVITGRFKDASRPRVFEFEISDSVSFKPFVWKRTDSIEVDPAAWEDFSKGYSYRYDAVKTVRKEKPTCGNTSYSCGKACISLNKNCKQFPPDKPSQEKLDKVRAMGGEFKDVKDDPTKRQEDNKLTPKPPEEIKPQPSAKMGAGAKYLADPSTNQWMKNHEGLKEIARAIDENDGVVDTGHHEYGDPYTDGTQIGEIKVHKLNKPSKTNVHGSATVTIKAYEEDGKQNIPLPRLADGVRAALRKKQSQRKPVEVAQTPNSTEGKGAIVKPEDINKPPIPRHPTLKETKYADVNQLLGIDSFPDSTDSTKYILSQTANSLRKKVKEEQVGVDQIRSNPNFKKEHEEIFNLRDIEEEIKIKQEALDYFDKISSKWKLTESEKTKPTNTPTPEPQKKIAQPETPRPDPVTADYDNWLNTEAEKLKGEKISYDLAVKGGVESVKGTNYGGLGVNKSIDKLTDKSNPKYSVTHLASGRKVGDFDDEEMAKKAVAELQKMGVDWQAKDLTKSSDKLANLHKTLNDVAVSHWRVLRERANKQDISTPEPQKKAEAIAKTPKTPKPKAVKVEDNAPPRPKLKSKENMVNLLYDDWLETESQKNQGRDAQYQVKFPSGDVSVQGRIYGNFGVHEDRTGKTPMYNITHLASGRALNRLENEDQAKKAIIELNRSGIDWSLNEAELMKDPKMQGKMKNAKKLMDIAVESDIRTKAIKSVGEELAYKKMARDEEARKPKVIPTDKDHRDELLRHLETKIVDLNLNDEAYKNALISRVSQEVKMRTNIDPDSYSANPYSLNTLVAAYLADKPDPPKFEDYVKNELPIEKSVKKLAPEAFWHFKDKKITSPLTV